MRLRKPPVFSTFLIPLMLAFLSLLLAPVGLLLVYVWVQQLRGEEINTLYLFLIAGCSFIFGYICFLRVGKAFRERFRTMIVGIREMTGNDRKLLQSKIQISTADEFGQLGLAFNDLQEYKLEYYADLEREMQLAYIVQQSLLPKGDLNFPGFSIAALCRQSKEVGGDFYDIVPLSDGKIAVIVGDVAGKGLQAALLMSAVMSLFRSEIRRGETPGEVITQLNRHLFQALQGRLFITAGLAIIDRNESFISYANAGHMSPYMLNEGQLEEFMHPSLPLGIMTETSYSNHVIPFPANSRFILYTDGMVESHREDGSRVGFDCFEQYLHEFSGGDLNQQMAELMERITKSTVRQDEDDRTLVMIERTACSSL